MTTPLLPRKALALAIAAGLLVPATAQAAPDDKPKAKDKQSESKATPSKGSKSQGEERRAEPKPKTKPQPKAKPEPQPRPQPGSAVGGGGQGDAGGESNGDPAGNNGTIKVDLLGGDSGHANRPHPGCAFQVRMFNFDDDQTGLLTITGQAPTPTDTLVSRNVLLSDDPAGGGQDVDEVYAFTLSDLGLGGVAPSNNGWHLKVAVNADGAPGGAKQKVFWLDCPTVPPTGSGGGSIIPGGSVPTRTVVRAQLAPTFGSGSVTVDPTTQPFTGGGGGLFGLGLPLTGFELQLLLSTAAASLIGGVMALRMGRRRTELSG